MAEEEEESEDWMTTYADAITLLMAFFVMLLTFSKYDVPAFEEAVSAIKNEVGGHEQVSKTEQLKENLEELVYDMEADQVVKVTTDDEGVVIELASSAFYKPGSADIREEAKPVLLTLAESLLAPRYRDFEFEIEGHTDDDPIHTRVFPSNWELSAGRATRVVRLFIEAGAEPSRLEATGYAASRPKVPNRDAEGTPNRENQAINRRVIVRVNRLPFQDREAMLDKMTEEDLKSERGEGEGEGESEGEALSGAERSPREVEVEEQ